MEYSPANGSTPPAQKRGGTTFMDMIVSLLSWRRLIVGVTIGAAILAVIISLLIPNTYVAASRLLLPDGGGGSGLLGMLDDLPSAAKSLIGGKSGDYTRYLAILGSRSVNERVVERFDLISVYELEDDRYPLESTLKELEDNVEFVIDKELDYLSIEVADRDPQRAADISNFYVSELNRVNGSLTSQTAGNLRQYIEGRYNQAMATMDSVQSSMQSFQERYGVYDLPTQLEGFFTQLVEMRVELLRVEAQYETALRQYGPDNPQVAALRDAMRSASQQYQNALVGQEHLMPVASSDVPVMARQYVDLERERMIQTRILEVLAPFLEQARMDELRQVEAVQVVDPAIPPVRKSYPKRMIIVVIVTMSAFLLTSLFVLALDWWRRNHALVSARIKEAADAREAQPADA